MGSHSEHGAFIRGLGATVLDADDPCDASATRDAVVNNLRHLHDEAGQIVVNLGLGASEYYEQSDPSDEVYRLLDGLYPFRFPLRRKPNGDSYTIVPYLRGYVSTGVATVTYIVQLSLAADGIHAPVIVSGSSPSMTSGTTTSTSDGAVTLSPTGIYLPSAAIDASPGAYRRFDSLRADGSMGGAEVLWALLTVWAISTQTGSKPRVSQFYAREYIGA
jgi:hypothetical protein